MNCTTENRQLHRPGILPFLEACKSAIANLRKTLFQSTAGDICRFVQRRNTLQEILASICIFLCRNIIGLRGSDDTLSYLLEQLDVLEYIGPAVKVCIIELCRQLGKTHAFKVCIAHAVLNALEEHEVDRGREAYAGEETVQVGFMHKDTHSANSRLSQVCEEMQILSETTHKMDLQVMAMNHNPRVKRLGARKKISFTSGGYKVNNALRGCDASVVFLDEVVNMTLTFWADILRPIIDQHASRTVVGITTPCFDPDSVSVIQEIRKQQRAENVKTRAFVSLSYVCKLCRTSMEAACACLHNYHLLSPFTGTDRFISDSQQAPTKELLRNSKGYTNYDNEASFSEAIFCSINERPIPCTDVKMNRFIVMIDPDSGSHGRETSSDISITILGLYDRRTDMRDHYVVLFTGCANGSREKEDKLGWVREVIERTFQLSRDYFNWDYTQTFLATEINGYSDYPTQLEKQAVATLRSLGLTQLYKVVTSRKNIFYTNKHVKEEAWEHIRKRVFEDTIRCIPTRLFSPPSTLAPPQVIENDADFEKLGEQMTRINYNVQRGLKISAKISAATKQLKDDNAVSFMLCAWIASQLTDAFTTEEKHYKCTNFSC